MKISFSFFKKHSTVSIVAAVVVVLIAVNAARNAKKPAALDTGSSKPVVGLINTKDYMQGSRIVSANGSVESLEQADLKSQATGKVTKIYVSVGQKVSQGQTLVTLENSSQAAALTSAKGALAQAQANYNRVLAGASNEEVTVAQVALDTATSNLENTKTQQATLVANAYKTLLNSPLSADPGKTNTTNITVTISGSYLGSEQGVYKINIFPSGGGWKYQYSGIENGSGSLSTNPQALGSKGLNITFSAITGVDVNDSWTVEIPNTQAATYVANYNAYQSALETQKNSIAAAENAVAAAQANLDLRKAAARPADIQAAEASVLTAQGQVQAAEAALNNTIIRAPFNGNISALPVKFADLVTLGQNVVSIVSQGGLQVKIFVSDLDLSSIHINDQAKIGKDMVKGTVRNVAPSVSQSNRTGEVDVSVDDAANSGLTVGQNVQVIISGQTETTATENSFLLPIQAVKISSDDKAYVYTLENNKAKQSEVIVGKVDGENVLVTSGLNADMQILSNAYGVREGDEVEIQK